MIWLYKAGCVAALVIALSFFFTFTSVALNNDSCKKCRAIAVPTSCFVMLFLVAMLAEKILT